MRKTYTSPIVKASGTITENTKTMVLCPCSGDGAPFRKDLSCGTVGFGL